MFSSKQLMDFTKLEVIKQEFSYSVKNADCDESRFATT